VCCSDITMREGYLDTTMTLCADKLACNIGDRR